MTTTPAATTPSTLESIAEYLQGQDYPDASVHPAPGPGLPPYVLVPLRLELDGAATQRTATPKAARPQLHLAVVHGVLAQIAELPTRTLQFSVRINVPVATRQLADVARLLMLFNKALELPGLALGEPEGVLYYRCAIPLDSAQGEASPNIAPKLVAATVTMIETALGLFAQPLRDVATGKRTLADVLAEGSANYADTPGAAIPK